MTVWSAILWILGAAGVLFLLSLGVVFWEKRKPEKGFDERQQAAQGRGYRFVFYLGIAYFLGLILYLPFCQDPVNEMRVLLYAGVLMELVAFHFYCLLTHAVLPLSRSPLVMVVIFLLNGLSQLILFLSRLDGAAGMLPLDRGGSVQWVGLALSVACLLLAASHLAAWFRREPEDDA